MNAILIGRLGMTTSEAIIANSELSAVFSDPKKGSHQYPFRATEFEAVFSKILRRVGLAPTTRMLDSDDKGRDCKT